MTRRRQAVFSVPASAPFLATVASALREGRLVPGFPDADDPLSICDATIYLPTRRAVRLAESAFVADGAVLLPRLVALGDVEEDGADTESDGDAADIAVPPPIAPTARRLLLARIVAALARARAADGAPAFATSPAATLALADECARLMDRLATFRVDWPAIDTLDTGGFDAFFQLSIGFVKAVATEHWPAILAERGEIDPADRRDRLLAREAARLREGTGGPAIVAGSTGSLPATRDLIAAAAAHPRGAVVLPGLDLALDEESWAALAPSLGQTGAPTHPQFGLRLLLDAIGIARGDVATLAVAARPAREALLSQAMRPAATTDRWRGIGEADASALDGALDGVSIVVADDVREEALAVALALRETLETPDRTAALVTPDRDLARRVAADLRRWDIEIDDSAGTPLADTPAGILARLVAEAAAESLVPVPLLGLLQHSLARFGLNDAVRARMTALLETAVLRGPRPAPGADGLRRALDALAAARATLHRSDIRKHLSDADLRTARALVDAVAAALAPLAAIDGRQAVPFARLVSGFAEALAATLRPGAGEPPASADLDAVQTLVGELGEAAELAEPMTLGDFAEVLTVAMRGIAVRPAFEEASRLRILGPLEARLVEADRVVLGGLVEGVWPPSPSTGPWLNRPMLSALGLDVPERRIGLAAHDFAQAFGAAEIVLSRARKRGGAPTVPSRTLQRLAAVAGEAFVRAEARGTERYLTLARMLDRPADRVRLKRPAPAPPLDLRPKRLSVTQIETWVRDPYSIFAQHILELEPLEAIDGELGPAERGTIVHDALARFLASHPRDMPADAEARLLALGREAFAPLDAYPEVRALWWPRFERVARWFVASEARARAARAVRSLVEKGGRLEVPDSDFVCTARADRLDEAADGRVTVIDYKTGRVPTAKEVMSGLAPQLPLEMAMVRAGGFEGIPAGATLDWPAYVRLSGGDPAGEWKSIAPTNRTRNPPASAQDLAERAFAGLVRLVAHFARAETGYVSIPRPQFTGRHGPYDHLARIKEWSATGGETADAKEDGE